MLAGPPDPAGDFVSAATQPTRGSIRSEWAEGLACVDRSFRPVHDGNGATHLGYVACRKPGNIHPAPRTFVDLLKPQS